MILYFFIIFLPQLEVPPSTLRLYVQYYIKILHRPRIIVGDAGFEPVTFASEVGRVTIELPHLCFCCISIKKKFLSAPQKIF